MENPLNWGTSAQVYPRVQTASRGFFPEMKAGWKIPFFIFATSLLAHKGLVSVYGIPCTQDFSGIYDPMAAQLIAWLQGAGDFPAIHHMYDLFHINYVFFMSAVYLVFGNGNHLALIAVQVVLSTVACLCMFHFLKSQYDSQAVAVGFTLTSFLFFDSMFMTIAGSPESLYRSIFLVSFLVLVHLHQQQRHLAFWGTLVISFAVLIGIRIDSLILFAPVYALGLKALGEQFGFQKPSLPVVSAGILILFFCFSLVTKLPFMAHPVFQLDQEYYLHGIVVADLGIEGKIEPLEAGARLSTAESLERGLRLFFLRVYQFLSITPPSWSAAHQIYYALHMVPLYLLALAGIVRTWQTRDFFFGQVIYCYAASIVLHGLTRVDAAHRTNFISVIFLIMLAGYGFDFLIGTLQKGLRNRKYGCSA
jgi:hypothetical protein